MNNLDDTLNKVEAKIPRVVNEPSSDNDSWSWDWNKDGDAILNKLGWKGLAAACAFVDTEGAEEKEDGIWPKKKASYYLPHHKLIDGELTLVWGGVRAAMQRLLQTWSRVKKGDVESDIDFEGAYKHLAAHYKHFDKEVPEKPGDKSESTFIKYPYTDEVEMIIDTSGELSLQDIYQVISGVIDKLFEEATWDLKTFLPWGDGDGKISPQEFDTMVNGLLVLDALKNKLSSLMQLLYSDKVQAKLQGGKQMGEAKNQVMEGVEATTVDVSVLEKEISELKAQLEAITEEKVRLEKEFADYKAQVEAEKEEQRKKELANTRLVELKEAGVAFSEERLPKVLVRLGEMDEEAYAEYKADLLEALAVSKKQQESSKASLANLLGADKEETIDDEEEIVNDEVRNTKAAFEVRRKRASLDLELVNTNTDLVTKFQQLSN